MEIVFVRFTIFFIGRLVEMRVSLFSIIITANFTQSCSITQFLFCFALVDLLLVVHEDRSLFKSTQLEILSRGGVEFEQVFELFCVQIHGTRLVILTILVLFSCKQWLVRLESDVGLQIEDQGVVIEEGIGWQLHESSVLLCLHLDHTARDQDHLIRLLVVTGKLFAGVVDTGVQPNDELISEARFTRVEEVLEPVDEFLEDQIDQLSLHLGR